MSNSFEEISKYTAQSGGRPDSNYQMILTI